MVAANSRAKYIDRKYNHQLSSAGMALLLNILFFVILLSNSRKSKEDGGKKMAGAFAFSHVVLLVTAIILIYAPKKTTSTEFKDMKELSVDDRTSVSISDVLARADTDVAKVKLLAYFNYDYQRGSLHKNLFLSEQEFARIQTTHTIQDLVDMLKESREERSVFYLTGLALIFGVLCLYDTILDMYCKRS